MLEFHSARANAC